MKQILSTIIITVLLVLAATSQAVVFSDDYNTDTLSQYDKYLIIGNPGDENLVQVSYDAVGQRLELMYSNNFGPSCFVGVGFLSSDKTVGMLSLMQLRLEEGLLHGDWRVSDLETGVLDDLYFLMDEITPYVQVSGSIMGGTDIDYEDSNNPNGKRSYHHPGCTYKDYRPDKIFTGPDTNPFGWLFGGLVGGNEKLLFLSPRNLTMSKGEWLEGWNTYIQGEPGENLHIGLDHIEIVPEPATILLLGIGTLALLRKRRI